MVNITLKSTNQFCQEIEVH